MLVLLGASLSSKNSFSTTLTGKSAGTATVTCEGGMSIGTSKHVFNITVKAKSSSETTDTHNGEIGVKVKWADSSDAADSVQVKLSALNESNSTVTLNSSNSWSETATGLNTKKTYGYSIAKITKDGEDVTSQYDYEGSTSDDRSFVTITLTKKSGKLSEVTSGDNKVEVDDGSKLLPSDTTLVIENDNSTSSLETAIKNSSSKSGLDVFQLFDIHLRSDDSDYEPVDDNGDPLPVKVTIKLDSNKFSNGDTVYVGHYEDNGTTLKDLSTDGSNFEKGIKTFTVVDGCITVYVNSFSKLMVAKVGAAAGSYTGTITSPGSLSDGDYIIVSYGTASGSHYAMTGSYDNNNSRLNGVAVDSFSTSSVTISDSSAIWTYDSSAGSFYNQSAGQYLDLGDSYGDYLSSSASEQKIYTISGNAATIYDDNGVSGGTASTPRGYHLNFSSYSGGFSSNLSYINSSTVSSSSNGVYFYKVEATKSDSTVSVSNVSVQAGKTTTASATLDGCTISSVSSSNNNIKVSYSGSTISIDATSASAGDTATITVNATGDSTHNNSSTTFTVSVTSTGGSQETRTYTKDGITGVTSLTVSKAWSGEQQGTSATVTLTGPNNYSQTGTLNPSYTFTGMTSGSSYTLTETGITGGSGNLNDYVMTSGDVGGGGSGGSALTESSLTSVADGGTYVFVYNGYALADNNGTLVGVAFNQNNIPDNAKWTISSAGSGYHYMKNVQYPTHYAVSTGNMMDASVGISTSSGDSAYARFSSDGIELGSGFGTGYIVLSNSSVSASGSSSDATPFTVYSVGSGGGGGGTGTLTITNTYSPSTTPSGNNTSGGTTTDADLTLTKSIINGVEEVGPDTTFGLNLEANANGSTVTDSKSADPADILLVFDQTNSLSSNGGIEALRSAASSFVSNLPTNSKSKIALMTFIEFYANQSYTAPVTTRMGWTSLTDSTKSSLSSLISSLTVQGSTYGYGTSYLNPLQQASSMLSSGSNSKKYVIFFSDGDADCDEFSSIQSAASTLQSQATVYAVASGSFSNYQKINAVASSGSAYQAANASALTTVFNNILSEITTTSSVSNTSLDSSAVFKDVINSDYFDTSEASATVAVYGYNNGSWSAINGATATAPYGGSESISSWTNKVTGEGPLTISFSDNTVSVSGFSYKDHYLNADGESSANPQKLVVQIAGLKLKSGVQTSEIQKDVHTNKDSSSGIFTNSSSVNPVKNFPEPDVDIPATSSGETPRTSGTDSVIVKKVWQDEDGNEITSDLPSNVVIRVSSDNDSHSVILGSGNDWQRTVTGLNDANSYTGSDGSDQTSQYEATITKSSLSRDFPTGGSNSFTREGNDYRYTYDNATSFDRGTGRANYTAEGVTFDGDVYIDSNVTVTFYNCRFKGSVIPTDNSAIASFDSGNAFYSGDYGALSMSGGNVFAQKAVNTAVTTSDNVRVAFPTAISINGETYNLVSNQTSLSRPSWASARQGSYQSGRTQYITWTITGTTPSQAGMQLFLVNLAYSDGSSTYSFSVPMYLQVGNVDATQAATIPVYTITNKKKSDTQDTPADPTTGQATITVTKEWDGDAPDGAVVTVRATNENDSTDYKEVELSASNKWQADITGLSYSAKYNVTETKVMVGSEDKTDDYSKEVSLVSEGIHITTPSAHPNGTYTRSGSSQYNYTYTYTYNNAQTYDSSTGRGSYTVSGQTFYGDVRIATNVTVTFSNCNFYGSIIPDDSYAIAAFSGTSNKFYYLRAGNDDDGKYLNMQNGSNMISASQGQEVSGTIAQLPEYGSYGLGYNRTTYEYEVQSDYPMDKRSSASFVTCPNGIATFTGLTETQRSSSISYRNRSYSYNYNLENFNISGTAPNQDGYYLFLVTATYASDDNTSVWFDSSTSHTFTFPVYLKVGDVDASSAAVAPVYNVKNTEKTTPQPATDSRVTVSKVWSGTTPQSGTTVVATLEDGDETYEAVLSADNNWTTKVNGTDISKSYDIDEISVTDRSGGDIKDNYQSTVAESGTAALATALSNNVRYVFANSSGKALSYSSGLGTTDVTVSGNDITTEEIPSSTQWIAVANGSGFSLRNGTNRYLRVNSGSLTTTTSTSSASIFTYSNGRLSTTSTSGSTTYFVRVNGSSASATTTATELSAYAVGSASSYTITNSEKSTPVNPDNPTTETPDHHKSADGDGSTSNPYTIHLNVTGKQQTSSETTKTGNVVDVVLVADVSGSMNSSKISNIQSAANSFVNKVLGSGSNLDARMALVEFGAAYDASHTDDSYFNFTNSYQGETWDDAKTDRTWTTSSSDMTSAVNALSSTQSSTNVEAGLREAATLLESARSNAQKVVILLSDGQPNIFYNSQGYSPYASGQSDAAISAAEAQADAMTGTVDAFYTVATGAGEGSDDMSFLSTIAQKFAKNGSYTATDSSGLTRAFNSIGTAITTTTTKKLEKITITDHLTEYMQLSGTSPRYGVTVTDSNGQTVGTGNYTVSVPYSDGKTIVVKFSDSFTFSDGVTYTVNIPITTTDKATETVNASDSDTVQLPTNTSAEIDYTYGGTSGSDTYPEEPTIDVTKTATGESDASYLQVTKTFTGIDADDIPNTFYMTATTGNTTYTLKASRNADGITLTKDSTGLIWTWKIKDATTGTYTVTEYDPNVEGKNLSTTFNGGTENKITINDSDTSLSESVTVAAADVQNDTDDPLETITSGSDKTISIASDTGKIKLFVIRQTGNNGAVVISEKSLNASVRKALEDNVLSKMSNGGDWTKGGVTYYVASQFAGSQSFTLARGSVKYDASAHTITFSSSNQWNMFAHGSISGSGVDTSDINVQNTYSDPNEVILTGVLNSPVGRIMIIALLGLAAIAGIGTFFRRRRTRA